MSSNWISDPLLWLIALPALAASGVLIQMVLSLFRCCGAFKLRGKPIQVTWWMIPLTGIVCGLLWTIAFAYAFLLA